LAILGVLGLTEFPPQIPSRLKSRDLSALTLDNTMAKTDLSARIAAAIHAIESGECADYTEAALKFEVDRTTISKRIRGITQSREDANLECRQCLTIAQEETLIQRINQLAERAMPPTSQIVRNLAEELRGEPVGKN
jgi:hypothetical protein